MIYVVWLRWDRGRCCLDDSDTGVAVIHVYAMNCLVCTAYLCLHNLAKGFSVYLMFKVIIIFFNNNKSTFEFVVNISDKKKNSIQTS